MAEEETPPNIDWGFAGDGTISTFTFSTMPNRHGFLRLSITTKEGRELDLIIRHSAVKGLQNACAEVRQKLGF
ncbi:MAG: hypothetical protein JO258_13780 [Alphaproteobacteria bacterium]|nr:hypothetical protein [Alphaproteobacteria bacterium]